jgi:hypothetical protein
MIHVEPFAPDHIAAMDVQPSQRDHLLAGDSYADAGPAWTARDDSGRIIFCGGFAQLGASYVHAWCVMATGKGADLVAVTRAARRVIAGANWRRVEMFSDARNEAASRWAEKLGFGLEGVRREALDDGGDMLVWAIIRGRT